MICRHSHASLRNDGTLNGPTRRLRMVLDAAKPQAILDGVANDVPHEVAQLLQAAIDADGNYLSASTHGVRGRQLDSLAPPLRELLERKTPASCRIPREKLWLS